MRTIETTDFRPEIEITAFLCMRKEKMARNG